MSGGPVQERNQGIPKPFLTRMILISIIDATVYVGGLDEKVTENVLWELFLQAGPVGML